MILKRKKENEELNKKRQPIIQQRQQLWLDSQNQIITEDVLRTESFRLANEERELKPLPNRIFLERKPVGEVIIPDDMKEDWQCTICLEHEYEEDQTDVAESELIRQSVVWIKCGHSFHFGCIDTLFNSTSKHICPFCKKNNGLEVKTIRTKKSYEGKRKSKRRNKKSKRAIKK